MGLNTGGSTSTTQVSPGSLQAGQAADAIGASGGSLGFMQPSPWFSLTPQSQAIQQQGISGLQQFTDPTSGWAQNYFKQNIAPTVENNSILGGMGRGTGADLAMSQAGNQLTMQMAQLMPSLINAQLGLSQAGQGLGQQDLARRQALYQNLMQMLGPSTQTTQQTQGPGVGASMANLGGSLLFGGQNPVASQLLLPLLLAGGSGLSSLLGLGGTGMTPGGTGDLSSLFQSGDLLGGGGGFQSLLNPGGGDSGGFDLAQLLSGLSGSSDWGF